MRTINNSQGNKLLVIKCGGSILNNQNELTELVSQLSELKKLGYQLVLVHGGGPDINQLCGKLALTSTFSNGLRVTTPEILLVTQMAMLGVTNPGLVHKLNQAQLAAIGLSGHDANLLQATYSAKETLGYVGNINQVNAQFIHAMLGLGLIPVIAPLAIDSSTGNTLNVNADLAAAAIAAALAAQQLILLSDIDGYYANYPDKNSLVRHLTKLKIQQLLLQPGQVADGMYPKLSACQNAVSAGVCSAHIVNGNTGGSLLQAVINPTKIGTSVTLGTSNKPFFSKGEAKC